MWNREGERTENGKTLGKMQCRELKGCCAFTGKVPMGLP